jgi:2,3-dihydroxybenzoate-AMP ligase
MALAGVVPFPPEFARRYREKGYWRDQSLAQEFSAVFEKYKNRIALIDGARQFTYGDIDRLSDNLALNLLELGLRPLDRVVPTLPNIAEFVILYFALQKIGAIPIAALAIGRSEDRPDRPVHLPALGRHHRHPEAHPAHAQRLRL